MKRLLRMSGLASALALSLLVAPASAQAAPDHAAAEVQAEIAASEAAMIDEVTLAASGCGSVCDGKDPATFKIYTSYGNYYTCGQDAITPTSGSYTYRVSDPTGSVELRYSPRCRTAWARTTASYVGIKVVSRYLNGNHRTTMTEYSNNHLWTAMVNDADLEAQACYSGTICTRWW
ncbi:DUF2690 domain-containing protein [Verrucosispora sioxanthis]|uniref:DUF2690 domain-containing protein n=1 Tax=Verrucosispora sioxanthis TaxID=2499994 RepID=A0A6M1KSD8_9ACTN|nr:DUF2690 domain-containing protein [Verrucosispora sioxanthis]NEE62815.1 DUF2690 domain-containing protein [Verrucosispora sioxanthis]NGM11925.1 DUF2690 domain-containing protein [Verrucosispora sioxanthis]